MGTKEGESRDEKNGVKGCRSLHLRHRGHLALYGRHHDLCLDGCMGVYRVWDRGCV